MAGDNAQLMAAALRHAGKILSAKKTKNPIIAFLG
jgi:hypothetical protein